MISSARSDAGFGVKCQKTEHPTEEKEESPDASWTGPKRGGKGVTADATQGLPRPTLKRKNRKGRKAS